MDEIFIIEVQDLGDNFYYGRQFCYLESIVKEVIEKLAKENSDKKYRYRRFVAAEGKK